MGLFKKLVDQVIRKDAVKTAKAITVQEKKEIEKELIFGTVLESLEVDLFEEVYKVSAIGQGGTETSVEYERESEEAAETAALDGLDVPAENILDIEKLDKENAENEDNSEKAAI